PLLGSPGPYFRRRRHLWGITHYASRITLPASRFTLHALRTTRSYSSRPPHRPPLPPCARLHAPLRELLLPRGHAASTGLRPLRRGSPAHGHVERDAFALPAPQPPRGRLRLPDCRQRRLPAARRRRRHRHAPQRFSQ